MGNISRTLSYLGRNGLVKTLRMSWQRLKEDREERDYGSERLREIADEEELAAQAEHVFRKKTKLSVLIPAYETDAGYLRALLESILAQSYTEYEVIIADAGSTGTVKEVVAGAGDGRLVYIKLKKNRGISENTNEALKEATGDAVVFIDHDDLIEPDAFYHLARAFEDGASMVYTDEDKYENPEGEKDGRYYRPNRKPDFNYDLLLSNNYISHLFAVRTDMVRALGGLRKEYDGAQDYDLILRCADRVFRETGFYEGQVTDINRHIRHVPRILYHWRVHVSSTAENPSSKTYAYEAGRKALKAHLQGRGIRCRVRHTEHLGFYFVDYDPGSEGRASGAGKDRRHRGKGKRSPVPSGSGSAKEISGIGELRFNIPPGLRIVERDYRRITAGVFQRKEVKAVVYRVLDRQGRIEEEPYRGQKWWDSGAQHRSAMPRDLDTPLGSAWCVRKGDTKGLIVYLPYIHFRRL